MLRNFVKKQYHKQDTMVTLRKRTQYRMRTISVYSNTFCVPYTVLSGVSATGIYAGPVMYIIGLKPVIHCNNDLLHNVSIEK